MSSTSRPARTAVRKLSWSQHLCRAVGADRNPLCRSIDRAHSRALVLAAAGVVLSLGMGAGAAAGSLAGAQQRAAAQAAQRHSVDAVLLIRAQPKTSSALGVGTSGYQARATWNYPPGQQRTSDVDVSGPAAAGSVTALWVDAGGRIAAPPTAESGLVADAVFLGLLTLAGLAMLTGAVFSARRNTLHRRAQNWWRVSWEQVEPIWSGACRAGSVGAAGRLSALHLPGPQVPARDLVRPSRRSRPAAGMGEGVGQPDCVRPRPCRQRRLP